MPAPPPVVPVPTPAKTKGPSIMGPPRDVEGGIGFLSRDDWFYVQSFVEMAIFDNPTTNERMATRLKLSSPKDPMWTKDFEDTVKAYDTLKGRCERFWNMTKPGLVSLADDIVAYEKKTNVVYTRLIQAVDAYSDNLSSFPDKLKALMEAWGQSQPPDSALSVQEKFRTGINRLLNDARERAEKADRLVTQLTEFRDGLLTSKSDFTSHSKKYENTYGHEGGEVMKLKSKLEGIRNRLNGLRKKDLDEVIVLSTSPVYLVIPVIGPLVLGGVLIGVGVDLAKVREEIASLDRDAATLQEEIGSKEAFMANYKLVQDLTAKTAEEIDAIIPYVNKLSDGWHSMKNQLATLARDLTTGMTEAQAENWFDAVVNLETAKGLWVELAQRAQHFSDNASVKKAGNIDELVKGIQKAA
jgi:hypothetical protein